MAAWSCQSVAAPGFRDQFWDLTVLCKQRELGLPPSPDQAPGPSSCPCSEHRRGGERRNRHRAKRSELGEQQELCPPCAPQKWVGVQRLMDGKGNPSQFRELLHGKGTVV